MYLTLLVKEHNFELAHKQANKLYLMTQDPKHLFTTIEILCLAHEGTKSLQQLDLILIYIGKLKSLYNLTEGWEQCTKKEVGEQVIRLEASLIMQQKKLAEKKTVYDEKLKDLLTKYPKAFDKQEMHLAVL